MKKAVDLSYPRPLCRRDSFINLNGEWNFVFEEGGAGEREPFQKAFPKDCLKINVPYCYQSKLSGINDQRRCDTIWYHKDVQFDRKDNQRVILHFDASDYLTYVFVNSKLVGTHKGGYASFEFDITDFLINNSASITVRCDDTYNIRQPRGKQKWKDKNFGCWYQEVSGIWKSVWAEVVEDAYIQRVRFTPKKGGVAQVELTTNKVEKDLTANIVFFLHGNVVAKKSAKLQQNVTNVDVLLDEVEYWSLEKPTLYEVKISLSTGDEITSQFGYRFISTKQGKIYLNDEELFMRLTLEQGYYPDGIYTFKDEKEIVDEIKLIKDAGFNGLRMHQKVEDDRFYYMCDVEGLLVWSEMPSCYEFDDEMVENVTREWQEVIAQHYNHPSILVWTPCNESWGVPGIVHNKEQHEFLDSIYDLTKKYDPTRLVVSNDGWEHCMTDLLTLHNYIQEPERYKEEFIDILEDIVINNKKLYKDQNFVPFADGYSYQGQPILIDEFCGIGFNVDKVDDGWGYGNQVKSVEEFYKRYGELVRLTSECKLVAGWCMTQISDVYQEVNGLVTLDRRQKFDLKVINKLNTQ